MNVLRMLLAALGTFALAACHSNPYYDPTKPHHAEDGFRNNYPHPPKGGFWSWKWDQFWEGLPREPEGGYRPEMVQPDLLALEQRIHNPSITWIGHATFLVQLGGNNLLTDPHLSERASPFSFWGPKRRVPPAIALEDLPHIDAVVISHNHYDHLDAETVERLAEQPGGPPRYFVPLGLKEWFADRGIESVTEMDWWEAVEFQGLTFHSVPVQHWSARWAFGIDTNETLWGGWVVEADDLRFFHAGDTGYSQDFKDIGERLGPIDLAAIPIGAYEPRWFMKIAHVNPEEAVMIHRDIGARYSVGMHWGTFSLTDETIDEPPQRLAEVRAAAGIPPERFFVMKFGETRELGPLLARAE